MFLGFHTKQTAGRSQRELPHLLITILLCSVVTLGACSFGVSTFSLQAAGAHRRNAEQFKTEGKLREAIVEYEKHIAERTAAANQFPGENPSFYYVMIGDLHLELEEPEQALDAYLKANDDGVMKEFIVDRLRQISAYYEAQERYSEAIELLSKYRELDPLLFDWDVDRLHKKSIRTQSTQDSFSIDSGK